MAAPVNLFFLLFLGCAFYFKTFTDARRLEIDDESDPDSNLYMSLAEKAKLLARKLSVQLLERDELPCIIARHFGNVMPTKNVFALSVPYTQDVTGFEKTHIEVEHESGTIGLDIIVFDKGTITLTGKGGKKACYIGDPKYSDFGIHVFQRRQ